MEYKQLVYLAIVFARSRQVLSPFAENLGHKPVDECEEFSASEGFRSRRSNGEKIPRS